MKWYYLFGKNVEAFINDLILYQKFTAEIIEEKGKEMTTQEKIKKLEKELAELKAECNKEYEIEYDARGVCAINLYKITKDYCIRDTATQGGRYRKSKEEAVRALKTQTRMMRLGALIEDCGGSKEFKEGEENYFLYYINCDKRYGYGHTYNSSCPERIYASKETIEKVVDILNSGRYKLDLPVL